MNCSPRTLPEPTDWKKLHADNVAKLNPELVAAAVKLLQEKLADSFPDIRKAMAADPQTWWVPYHFWAMMGVRNMLRQNGFGEKEFAIDNLDDYAVGLVELAVEQSPAVKESS